MCKEALLACYSCFQLQLEAGKTLFKGLGRANMSENVILGVSQAEVSGHMSVKVVPNTRLLKDIGVGMFRCAKRLSLLDTRVFSSNWTQEKHCSEASVGQK